MKFRKKPVVIDAIQLNWDNWQAICEFVPRPWFQRGVWLNSDGTVRSDLEGVGAKMGLIIRTLESQEFVAQEDDWIIKGVNGEFYACKPDIFDKTYEEVI